MWMPSHIDSWWFPRCNFNRLFPLCNECLGGPGKTDGISWMVWWWLVGFRTDPNPNPADDSSWHEKVMLNYAKYILETTIHISHHIVQIDTCKFLAIYKYIPFTKKVVTSSHPSSGHGGLGGAPPPQLAIELWCLAPRLTGAAARLNAAPAFGTGRSRELLVCQWMVPWKNADKYTHK